MIRRLNSNFALMNDRINNGKQEAETQLDNIAVARIARRDRDRVDDCVELSALRVIAWPLEN
jgi:hypothetical protein